MESPCFISELSVNSRYDYDTDEEHAIEAAIEEGFTGYTMAYENNDVPATER